MKLHVILIGIVTTLLLTTGASMYYAGLSEQYNAAGYNETSLESYNDEVSQINQEVNQTSQRIKQIKRNPLVPDLLGAVLIGGIGALNNLDNVLDITFNAFTSLVELIPLGPIGSILVAVITSVVLIAFFIGIVLSVITKSNRV